MDQRNATRSGNARVAARWLWLTAWAGTLLVGACRQAGPATTQVDASDVPVLPASTGGTGVATTTSLGGGGGPGSGGTTQSSVAPPANGGSSGSGGASATGGSPWGGTGGTSTAIATTAATGGSVFATGGTMAATGGSSGGRDGAVPDGPTTGTDLPTATVLLELMRKVVAYQIDLGPEDPSWVNKWTEATFYIGVMAAYLATHDSSFLTDATTWAAGNQWTLLGSPTRNADNQCAGQVYEDIYLADPVAANASMVANIKTNIDAMVAAPRPGIDKGAGDDWWWCDALFMAPGAVARLAKITGDAKYARFLSTMWAATQAGLFDTKTGLFWRDATFVGGTVYWSRGNGWVMAGLVRVLQALPEGDPGRDAYVALLRTMAAAVVPHQQADGTWHADLTHPAKYGNPESSGTGLIAYALAWGINQGVLDAGTYRPVVAKAWRGLAACIDGRGRVGCVQATGSAPAAAAATETHDYGVGAVVLAASEIYCMIE